MFEKKDFEMLKNTICAKTLFFCTNKKTPHWSHDWWGVEKNMFN